MIPREPGREHDRKPGDPESAPKAEHGYRNEVSWDGGKGRQPYPNQEQPEDAGPDAAPEAEGGTRGEAAGRTLEQMDQVRRKP